MSSTSSSFKPDPKLPTPNIHNSYREKQASQFLEPCELASKATFRCLDRNNYDKRKCNREYLQYRECKRKWLEERKELRRQGLL
ncbi:2706_t:CDS:2 [Ambispora gerdemannii]|uniref:2706_t:CDS:1 n=1 Tax=Ambispora gerdemannii TaxID=144530 RepID=A0A9N8V3P1_9GLOM|nr:2706_t:CDS:2 [Ambispora gerdemannii]